MTGSPAKATTKTVVCRLKELQAKGLERLRQGAVFWPYSWRSKLCTCMSCKVNHKYKFSYNVCFNKATLQVLALYVILIHVTVSGKYLGFY